MEHVLHVSTVRPSILVFSEPCLTYCVPVPITLTVLMPEENNFLATYIILTVAYTVLWRLHLIKYFVTPLHLAVS